MLQDFSYQQLMLQKQAFEQEMDVLYKQNPAIEKYLEHAHDVQRLTAAANQKLIEQIKKEKQNGRF